MHFAQQPTADRPSLNTTRAKGGSRYRCRPARKRTMFAARRAASTLVRGPAGRMMGRQTVVRQGAQQQQRRNMGGGSHWMEVSEVHTRVGEAFGFICWIWVFHRARNDLPVVLGWRHPWEHAEDPWAVSDHVDNEEVVEQDWNEFMTKSIKPGEDDDDDDEDDEDDDEDDDDEDEE